MAIKILFVSSFFPTAPNDDLPLFLLEQVNALAEYDTEITVLAATRMGRPGAPLAPNITVRRFNYFWPTTKQNLTNLGILPAISKSKWNIFQVPLMFYFEYRALAKAVREVKPDYIYSHWFLPQGLLCHIHAKRNDIPHVFTSHSYDVEICKKLPFFGRKMVRAALSSVKAASAVSQRTLDGISSFYSGDEWADIKHKFQVIPMGIHLPDIEDIVQQRKVIKTSALSGKKVLLFMGRFVEKKGIHTLLKALKIISEKDPAVILILAGVGPIATKIDQWILDLDLKSKVIQPGFVTQKEKAYYLRNSHLYILPSISGNNGDREGLPVSLLEAMSYQKICIASVGSGAEEVINDNVNGYLCEAGYETSLVQKIELALGSSREETLYMARLARAKAEQYSWNYIARKQYRHFFN